MVMRGYELIIKQAVVRGEARKKGRWGQHEQVKKCAYQHTNNV
jgi:hypothetical protein